MHKHSSVCVCVNLEETSCYIVKSVWSWLDSMRCVVLKHGIFSMQAIHCLKNVCDLNTQI